MIPRMTTVGTLKNYRYDLNRSNNTMSKAMNTVMTGRAFNSYAEDPAIATRCFQLRRSYQRAASQLTVNDSLYRKYNQAWSALEEGSQDIYSISNDPVFGSLIRGLNGADASGRNALGQSLEAKAKNLVQIMNGRHGENYVFSGADTLNVPFTWEPRENPDYIDPAIAQAKLDEEAANPGTLTPEEVEKYQGAFQYVAAGGKLTNNVEEAETVAKVNTDPNIDFTQPSAVGNEWYLNEKGEPVVNAADAQLIPRENPAYDKEKNTAFQYLTSNGEPTNKASEAQTVLCYRGVPVDANPDTEDGKKLAYFLGETKNLDVGLGHKEKDSEAVSSTVFNSALQGIYYLGGTGTKEITVTVGEGADAREVTREVPNNIVSVISRMGEILQRCSNEDGSFSGEDEEEFIALAHQFEDQKDLYIQRRAELDTETGFLRDNSLILTDTAESLSQQFLAMEDVDPAAAITDYMYARYCYDAALKVGNSVLSQSLMDYMNF